MSNQMLDTDIDLDLITEETHEETCLWGGDPCSKVALWYAVFSASCNCYPWNFIPYCNEHAAMAKPIGEKRPCGKCMAYPCQLLDVKPLRRT